MIKPEIFDIFHDVTEITIDTVRYSNAQSDAWPNEDKCCSVSMVALLSMIKNVNLNKVIVRSYVLSKRNGSYILWLKVLWNK